MLDKIYKPQTESTNIHIKNIQEYEDLYNQSIKNPSEFFGKLAKNDLHWIKDFGTMHNNKFSDIQMTGCKTLNKNLSNFQPLTFVLKKFYLYLLFL